MNTIISWNNGKIEDIEQGIESLDVVESKYRDYLASEMKYIYESYYSEGVK